jgi:hypothetical protein
MNQTAPRMPSEIEGKEQNCTTFGMYEPAAETTRTRNLCHGGWYEASWYEPCPVRSECYVATSSKKRTLPVVNSVAPAKAVAQEGFVRLPAFRGPNFSGMPTQHPQATTPRDAVRAKVAEVMESALHGAEAYVPHVVSPGVDAPPGMRTPFVGTAETAASPTFIPREGQSTFERLFFNILQAIIAAIGYQVWSFARSIDIFSTT